MEHLILNNSNLNLILLCNYFNIILKKWFWDIDYLVNSNANIINLDNDCFLKVCATNSMFALPMNFCLNSTLLKYYFAD